MFTAYQASDALLSSFIQRLGFRCEKKALLILRGCEIAGSRYSMLEWSWSDGGRDSASRVPTIQGLREATWMAMRRHKMSPPPCTTVNQDHRHLQLAVRALGETETNGVVQ
jgi:hypothetical protein